MAEKIFKFLLLCYWTGLAMSDIGWNCENLSPNASSVNNRPPEDVRMPFSVSTDKAQYGLEEHIKGM